MRWVFFPLKANTNYSREIIGAGFVSYLIDGETEPQGLEGTLQGDWKPFSGLAWRTFRLELRLPSAHTGGRHPTLGTPLPKEEGGAGWPWVRCQSGLSSTQ
mgnify:CR=1 FL=1